MAKCDDCNKEMLEADSCDYPQIRIDDEWFYRSTYHFNEHSGRCHDCGILLGQIHHFGCDVERCPKCGGQLISCDCTKQELRRRLQ